MLEHSGNKDGRRSGKQEDSKALVTIDGEGVDWTFTLTRRRLCLKACNELQGHTEMLMHRNKGIYSRSQIRKLKAQLEALPSTEAETNCGLSNAELCRTKELFDTSGFFSHVWKQGLPLRISRLLNFEVPEAKGGSQKGSIWNTVNPELKQQNGVAESKEQNPSDIAAARLS
ncbi:hypothetical protein Tco_0227952 [Tanacetum coccineum]